MGLLASLFNSNTGQADLRIARMMDGYAPIFTQFGRSIYSSDVVQQCIDCIATECSKLIPQHVLVDDQGFSSPISKDPSGINRLFRFAPNPLMTTGDFIEKTVWLLYLNYNAFIYPEYYLTAPDKNGNHNAVYTAFYPLNPITVEFLQDESETLFVRLYFRNGEVFTLPYSSVIHLRKKFSINDFMGGGLNGVPDNSALLQVLATNDIVMQGIPKAIQTNLSVRGILKVQLMDWDKQQAERLKFEEAISQGKTSILPLDAKGDFTPINFNPSFLDAASMKFLEDKVLRWFNVPLPILSGDYTSAQKQAFFNKTILPIAMRLGQAFSATLFTQRQQDVGHAMRFYQANLELMDIRDKLDFVKTVGDRGILTDNQIAATFGLPPTEDGNKKKMSLNYINANLADAYQMMRVHGEAVGRPSKTEPKTEVEDDA